MEKIKLPITNEYGCYEIRLESIGGLGANLSGKLLGELGALYMGLNASCFSSYGSEKRGSPVKSFIRYANAETEMRVSSPVERPHILGLFHEGTAGKSQAMAGVMADTGVILNTALNPEEARHTLKMHAGILYCIDALKTAMEFKTRVNMVMLGAVAKASGFMEVELLEEIVKDTLGRKYPAALESNLKGIRAGYDRAEGKKIEPDGKYPYIEYRELHQDWGYKNAPLGGVNPIPGSTVSNDLSASREGYIPVFKKSACINCGMCDTTCPDQVYQFVDKINLGPDYHHCKGCLRCVEVCPTDALTAGFEREHDIMKNHVRNQALIVDRMAFEAVGSSSWVESESTVVNEIY